MDEFEEMSLEELKKLNWKFFAPEKLERFKKAVEKLAQESFKAYQFLQVILVHTGEALMYKEMSVPDN